MVIYYLWNYQVLVPLIIGTNRDWLIYDSVWNSHFLQLWYVPGTWYGFVTRSWDQAAGLLDYTWWLVLILLLVGRIVGRNWDQTAVRPDDIEDFCRNSSSSARCVGYFDRGNYGFRGEPKVTQDNPVQLATQGRYTSVQVYSRVHTYLVLITPEYILTIFFFFFFHIL